jgi:hypothetical protein
MYSLEVPICRRSMAQKGVTLSSSEAEYVAMSKAVKEIRFIFYLLRCMFIEVKLPIIVRCDNMGEIFMAENSSSGVRTRHVDARYHFVCEHIVDVFIKFFFVKSCENDGDVFTKYVRRMLTRNA